MLGELYRSGIGTPAPPSNVGDAEELKRNVAASNESLLAELREDKHAAALLSSAREDAALGRMTSPAPLGARVPDDLLLHPRFAVEQSRPDGSLKLRPVDDFSWSPSDEEHSTKRARKSGSVNGFTFPAEKMHHHTLDAVVEAMRVHVEALGDVPGLYKASPAVGFFVLACARGALHSCWQVDVDSAFRRVPIRPSDRWACGIAFKCGEEVSLSFRQACVAFCISLFCRCTLAGTLPAPSAPWRPFTVGNE